MKTYVITGATGHIGSIVAKQLLSAKQHVKVIGRSEEKLKELVALGATPLIGDTRDREFLTGAFQGADAVFCLLAPDTFATDVKKAQQAIADNYYEAAKANHVPYVMLLSSVGAHLRNGAGIVDGLGYMEDLFLQLKDTHVLNLRPTYFMENTFGLIGIIRQMGVGGGPISPEVSFPVVATTDIGAVASARLLNLDFSGNSIAYVLGARDYTYAEITSLAGKAIGNPDLKYVQFPYEDAVKGMVAAGFAGEDAARLMVDLAKAINNGTLLNAHLRDASNTTPTTYEEFAHIFAHVYNMA